MSKIDTLPIEEDSVANPPRSSGLAFDEETFRRIGYQVIDEAASYLNGIRERPVWQSMPDNVHKAIREQELPAEGHPFEEALAFMKHMILPFPQGNGHPRFAGWINSAPAHAGVLVKPLAAAMNPNCGIGDHAGQELERRTVQWMMELCGFPVEGSAGVFVSGGSEANFTCLQAARQWAAQVDGWDVRAEGVQGMHRPFVLYQSDQGHFCIRRSVEAMGLGRNAIHIIPSTPSFQMDVDRLREQILADWAAGLRPFCVAATAGTVETGAIDPLDDLADLCDEQGLWLHVDGAYGAFGILDEHVALGGVTLVVDRDGAPLGRHRAVGLQIRQERFCDRGRDVAKRCRQVEARRDAAGNLHNRLLHADAKPIHRKSLAKRDAHRRQQLRRLSFVFRVQRADR